MYASHSYVGDAGLDSNEYCEIKQEMCDKAEHVHEIKPSSIIDDSNQTQTTEDIKQEFYLEEWSYIMDEDISVKEEIVVKIENECISRKRHLEEGALSNHMTGLKQEFFLEEWSYIMNEDISVKEEIVDKTESGCTSRKRYLEEEALPSHINCVKQEFLHEELPCVKVKKESSVKIESQCGSSAVNETVKSEYIKDLLEAEKVQYKYSEEESEISQLHSHESDNLFVTIGKLTEKNINKTNLCSQTLHVQYDHMDHSYARNPNQETNVYKPNMCDSSSGNKRFNKGKMLQESGEKNRKHKIMKIQTPTYAFYVYICSYCNQIFPNYENYVKHNTITTQANRNCFICKEIFEFDCQLHKHLKTHKKCSYCDQTFPNYNSLVAHFESTDMIKRGKHVLKCSICDGEPFKYPCQLSKHLEMHKECLHCNDLFADYNTLMRHVHYVRSRKKQINKCWICDEHFEYLCQLSKHELTHKECPHCHEIFTNSNTLREHVHSMKKQINKCWICDEHFDYQCQLSKHLLTHKECPHCNEIFANYNTLMKHVHSMRTLVKECWICDEHFDHQCQLSKHLLTHKECPHCNEIFPDYKTLLTHILTHN